MPAYSFRFIGLQRQIVAEPVVLRLAGDGEALIRATQMSTADRGAQVWRERRLICQVPPGARAPGRRRLAF